MIYFDNASTTKMSDDVIEYTYNFMKNSFANPSSLHSLGFDVEKEIQKARKSVADVIKASPDEIYFTSGGTEANNTAILGVAEAYKRRGNRVITMSIEHPSVTDSYKELEKRGFEVITLKVDNKGYIDLNELENAVNDDTILVSIMYVNNEVGTVQDIESIYNIIKSKNKNCVFHTDCVQAFCKHSINCKYADIITMSGHKIQSAKGVGAMYIKKGVRVNNLHFGGGQEKGFRPGTENTYGIAAMGYSAYKGELNRESNFEKVSRVRNTLLKITNEIDGVYVNGDMKKGSPYILNLSFDNIKGEVLLHALESDGIYVATGSACSTKVKEKKKIVDYVEEGRGASAVRFSFSCDNTVKEAEKVLESLKKHIPMLRRFIPR